MAYRSYGGGYGGGRSYGRGSYSRGSYGRKSYGGRSYGGRSYSSGYGGGYSGFGGSYRRKTVKRSGARSGIFGTERTPYVAGWKKERQGVLSVFCRPTSGTKQVTSGNGRLWENWMVSYKVGREKKGTCSGMYECSTGRVIIADLSMVINPKAPNGGYCGNNYQRKRR